MLLQRKCNSMLKREMRPVCQYTMLFRRSYKIGCRWHLQIGGNTDIIF